MQGKPLTGTILGAFVGLFVVVIIQQAGLWPLDQMLTFGAMGIMALVGFLITKGAAGGTAAKVFAIVMIVLMLGVGAVGATDIGSAGYLDGGCTASATSDIDAIPSPAATSKSDPFDVDPRGTLSWDTTSPAPIENHHWEIWVDVAGFPYLAAEGGSPNDGKSQTESGGVDLLPYAEDLEAILGTSDIGGIYEVGGFIDGDGGSCEGMALVRIPNGLFEGVIALIATAVIIILMIILLIIGRSVRRVAEVVGGSVAGEPVSAPPEILPDGFESGDTAPWGDAK